MNATTMVSFVALLAVAGGCASYSQLGSARVLDPGKMRFTPAVTVGAAETDQKVDVETVQPQLELGVAVGIVEDFELGARVWTLPAEQLFTIGGQLNAKFQLYRPDDPTSGVHVALAPRLSYHRAGNSSAAANAATLAVPLLIGITFGDLNELVFGPTVGGLALWSEGGEGSSTIFAATAGGSVGAILWVSDCFAIVPEASVHWSSVTAEDDDVVWFWQVGLGVVFDLQL